MSRRREAVKVIVLFLATLGVLQSGILGRIALANDWLLPLAFLITICISIVVIEYEGTSYREYGFTMPSAIGRHLAFPIFFAVSYVFTLIFLPGIFLEGFEAFPSISMSFGYLTTITILLGAIATEIIFRGYIQTNLSSRYGFLPAIIISSIMSTVCLLTIPFYAEVNSTMLLQNAIVLFAESVFLSVLFRKTRTLLCPIAYSATTAFLYAFTPLKAVEGQYSIPFMTLPYVLFILVTDLLVPETDETEASAITEPSEPLINEN